MKVYVVMSNDYPNCVFGNQAAADAYVAKRKLEDNPTGSGIYRRVYWRHVEHELDKEGHPV
ncbi:MULTISPECIES: hypothetical protein [unclassified Bradyrhizobium]|uniref:hypothetical protein n=1 Tax=unclassified Bradyrhizobium TaxID=2631580 RepID=UPI0028E8EC3D|nr:MULTISPECIES: hypothetical protein [unclassified Bradyrhizobium]